MKSFKWFLQPHDMVRGPKHTFRFLPPGRAGRDVQRSGDSEHTRCSAACARRALPARQGAHAPEKRWEIHERS